jgi:integrase
MPIEGFAEFLAEAGLSTRTQKLYSFVARKAGGYPAPEELLQDEKLAPATRKMYSKALLRYADFLGDKGLRERILEVRPKGGARRSRPVSALSWQKEWLPMVAELHKVRELAPTDWAVLIILVHSGMRISDVLELTVEDLRRALRYGSVVITQRKTQRQRAFLGTGPVWESVGHLAQEGATVDEALTVEQLLRTKRCPSRSGIEDRLRRALSKAGASVGIVQTVTPYVCRRTMADAIRKATKGDMKIVQEFLGHDKLETTLRWYQDHMHIDELEAAAEKALSGRPSDP